MGCVLRFSIRVHTVYLGLGKKVLGFRMMLNRFAFNCGRGFECGLCPLVANGEQELVSRRRSILSMSGLQCVLKAVTSQSTTNLNKTGVGRCSVHP